MSPLPNLPNLPQTSETRQAELRPSDTKYAEEQTRLRKKEQEDRDKALTAESRRRAQETKQNR